MILIVQSLWNASVTSELATGAERILAKHDYRIKTVQVPGALEIPLAVQWYFDKWPVKGVVACGTVIRGETHHFDIVANESSRALVDLSIKLKIPIGNAILAVYHQEQALERIGGKYGHKGEEAAQAVLDMLNLQRTI